MGLAIVVTVTLQIKRALEPLTLHALVYIITEGFKIAILRLISHAISCFLTAREIFLTDSIAIAFHFHVVRAGYHTMRRYLIAVSIGIGFAWNIHADDAILVTASAGLRQTVESVRTLQSRLQCRSLVDGSIQIKLENYWQDGDKKRSRVSVDGGTITNQPQIKVKTTHEAVIRSGRVLGLETVLVDGKPPQLQARISQNPRDAQLELSDRVWTSFGLSVTDMPKIWLFDVLIGNREWTWTAKWADLNGVRTIHLQTTRPGDGGDATMEVWLDPKEGYWPRKTVVYGSNTKSTRDDPAFRSEVTRFHPPYKQTGVSFPATVKIRYRSTNGKTLTVWESDIEIEDVRINEAIPDSTFNLTIPPGFWVVDRTTGMYYTMGENGKPKTTPQPIVPVSDLHPLEEETSSWPLSNYLLIAGGVIGCLAAARLWMKRRTPSSQDAGVTS